MDEPFINLPGAGRNSDCLKVPAADLLMQATV